MEKTIDFNINRCVWVRLTDYGRAIHKKIDDGSLKEDEAGWSRWQLHILMKIFGAHITLEGLPFETTIKMEMKELP